MKYWTMRNGEQVPIPGMTDSHLVNAIKFVKRKAKEGITICDGDIWDTDSFWVDEITGKEVYRYFENYYSLIREAKKRNLELNKRI